MFKILESLLGNTAPILVHGEQGGFLVGAALFVWDRRIMEKQEPRWARAGHSFEYSFSHSFIARCEVL